MLIQPNIMYTWISVYYSEAHYYSSVSLYYNIPYHPRSQSGMYIYVQNLSNAIKHGNRHVESYVSILSSVDTINIALHLCA